MQFNVLTTITLLVAAVSAIPTTSVVESSIEKRTCGTLSGAPLKVCQQACEAACTLVTAALASSLCKSACTAGPL